MLDDDTIRMCRLCLKPGDWEIDIFNPKGTNGFLLWIILQEIVEIQASQGDGLPHSICDKCMKTLWDCKNFKMMCINARIEFLKLQIKSGLVVHKEILEEDIFSLCRLCLKMGDWVINTLDRKGTDGFLVWIIMKELVEVQVYQGDGLPHTICGECMKNLSEFKHFKAMCINSRIEFLKLQISSGLVAQVNSERGTTDDLLDAGDMLSHSDSLGQDDGKTEVSEASDRDAEVEPCDDGEDGTGRGVGEKDQGAFSEQDCGTTDTLRRRIQSRRRGGGGSQSCFGRPTLRKRITCLECGSSFACKFSLSTHICIDRRGRRALSPERKGDLNQRNKDNTTFLHPNDKEVFGICDDLHVRKRREEFICDHCGKVYSLRVHLINHMRSVHLKISNSKVAREKISCQRNTSAFAKKEESKGVKKFICDYCGKGFPSKSKLLRHIVPVHLRPKTFCCKICSHNFTRKSELKEHIISVHVRVRRHECEECGKDFKSAVLLKSHMLRHLKTRPHPCTLCPRSFVYKGGLKSHMVSHSRRKPTCEVCGKKYYSAKGLRQHMLRHSDERPFQCKECPKSFKTSGDLSTHSLVHSDLRRHACGVCGKKFSRSIQLDSHMRTHDGKRPFECKICHKTFGTHSGLLQHVARHGERRHECEVCQKFFKTKVDLNEHVVIHGPKDAEKRLKCAECSKTFHRKSKLSRHMATHTELRPYVCEVCSMAFKTNDSLKQHDKVHHQKRKRLGCKRCHKLFLNKYSLKRHMACHCDRRNDCELRR